MFVKFKSLNLVALDSAQVRKNWLSKLIQLLSCWKLLTTRFRESKRAERPGAGCQHHSDRLHSLAVPITGHPEPAALTFKVATWQSPDLPM